MSNPKTFTSNQSIMLVLSGLLTLLAALLWQASSGFAAPAPEFKFGYVDLQQALVESEAGEKAFAQLKGEFKKKEQDVRQKEEELKEMQAELSKQSSVLSERARREKEENYRRFVKDYKRFVTDSEQELQAREKEYTEKILKELIEVIQKFGKEKGYTMIWEKKGIIYAPEKIDLTNELIKVYDGSKK